ncbi:MAG TPA: hemerythrin domain-containing protein [Pseudonocardiaceae bacterium]|jgi:hemerythrin-like domain-containing protein|nr:hemerythrin domain-containing protein [Pseudonocardiaceae bacterium]
MPEHAQDQAEGLRIYDELIAVHTIMRRGTILTATALERFASGTASNTKPLGRLIRWQAEFVHHHHRSEDELFWPVLRELFPEAVASLDELTEQHHILDTELDSLSAAAGDLADRATATRALRSAEKVRDVLASHLDTEEPVLLKLFPQTPAARIVELRKAIVAGAPRSGPDLVLGLLEDPEPAQGAAIMQANFPPPVRLLRPLFLRRYRAQKQLLEG